MDTDNNLEDRYIAAADLGSGKIALAVARVEGNSTQILFYRTVRSSGIRHGEVLNPKLAATALGGLIHQAEDELNIKIHLAAVGLPRCGIRMEEATGELKRTNPDDCISFDEIESIKAMARDASMEDIGEKEKLYSVIAQSFSIGDYFQLIENDVEGMTGDTLSGHFKVFIGRKQPEINIGNLFGRLGIAIGRMYFSPLATGRAVLTEEEKSNGVALIDLGSGATSVSIFSKKVLAYYAAIPFGGNSVTMDIQAECGISEELAENIKKAFGGCMPDKLLTLGEKILQIETDDMSAYRQIPVHYISEVISAREQEIIEAMLYHIQKSHLAAELRKGIVITGGGAEMLNIANLIKSLSGYNVRVAYPRHGFAADGFDMIRSADASTIAGIVLMARDENLNCCSSDGAAADRRVSVKPEPAVTGSTCIAEKTPEGDAVATDKAKDLNTDPSAYIRTDDIRENPDTPGKPKRGLFSWFKNAERSFEKAADNARNTIISIKNDIDKEEI